jgi:hypothetical protein
MFQTIPSGEPNSIQFVTNPREVALEEHRAFSLTADTTSMAIDCDRSGEIRQRRSPSTQTAPRISSVMI